jgi:hypothetical protein
MKTLTMYRPNTIQETLSDFDKYLGSFFGDSILAPAAKIFKIGRASCRERVSCSV